jgi:hypothetical protein
MLYIFEEIGMPASKRPLSKGGKTVMVGVSLLRGVRGQHRSEKKLHFIGFKVCSRRSPTYLFYNRIELHVLNYCTNNGFYSKYTTLFSRYENLKEIN